MGNSQSRQQAQDSAMCGDEAVSIEVFQDLTLTSRNGQRSALRDALHRNATPPWRHAEEREREFPDTPSEFLAFQRAPGDTLAASGLTLCARPDGYEVVNIVPLEADELGISGYNDILNDFIERVVGPASQELEFDVGVTPRKQSITDWASDEVASALHTFSVCANKSTGAGHPADRKRWFEFLFAAHNSPSGTAARLPRSSPAHRRETRFLVASDHAELACASISSKPPLFLELSLVNPGRHHVVSGTAQVFGGHVPTAAEMLRHSRFAPDQARSTDSELLSV